MFEWIGRIVVYLLIGWYIGRILSYWSILLLWAKDRVCYCLILSISLIVVFSLIGGLRVLPCILQDGCILNLCLDSRIVELWYMEWSYWSILCIWSIVRSRLK